MPVGLCHVGLGACWCASVFVVMPTVCAVHVVLESEHVDGPFFVHVMARVELSRQV